MSRSRPSTRWRLASFRAIPGRGTPNKSYLNGVVSQARYTITTITPGSYTIKREVATPDSGWATVMEGKASRTQ